AVFSPRTAAQSLKDEFLSLILRRCQARQLGARLRMFRLVFENLTQVVPGAGGVVPCELDEGQIVVGPRRARAVSLGGAEVGPGYGRPKAVGLPGHRDRELVPGLGWPARPKQRSAEGIMFPRGGRCQRRRQERRPRRAQAQALVLKDRAWPEHRLGLVQHSQG